jgi:hypothetical protein
MRLKPKASAGILRSVELIHGKAPKGLGFDRPKAARSSPSSALLAGAAVEKQDTALQVAWTSLTPSLTDAA